MINFATKTNQNEEMNRMKTRFLLLFVLLCVVASSCQNIRKGADVGSGQGSADEVVVEGYIPQEPHYADSLMWITADDDSANSGADVFYVVSTWEEDWTTDGGQVCHFADVWNAKHRERMAIEMNKAKAYMAPGNRFYAPYYRHATIDAFISQDDDTISCRTRLAMRDVCTAFDHFLSMRDSSRPFIIAGFSQGGMAVVELLKHMDDSTYEKLVAAYVLGYKVTPEDTASCHRIRPAQGETDTGVTICYNTVKDVKFAKPVIAATCIGINPVNWRTDATPALLHDTITVTLDTAAHVLVVENYSGAEYKPYKNLINVGDIHSCEPWLYSECLARNMAVRTWNWRMQQQVLRRVAMAGRTGTIRKGERS